MEYSPRGIEFKFSPPTLLLMKINSIGFDLMVFQ